MEPKKPTRARISWLVENEILFLDTEDPARPGEASFDDMIIEYLDTATQPIKVIVRVRNSSAPDLPTPKRATGFKYLRHPRLDQVCLVGLRVNPMVRFVTEVVKRVLGVQIKNFDTLEEALSYLEHLKA